MKVKKVSQKLLKKKTAKYKRTSSGGQDLSLQKTANMEYCKEHQIEDAIPFVDFDVSATKLQMDDRPALKRMLELIRQGYINRVVVYDRDRLARNVYEYIYIVKDFYEYDIEVIFTATNAYPFSKDLYLETWLGLSAQFEGERIRSRLADARRRNPPSMIGYDKKMIQTEKGNKQRFYRANEDSKSIHDLFCDFALVETRENVFETIMKYQTLLKRTDFRIIDILKNPFFSAHKENLDGSYSQLTNVEPIISLDLFKKVQNIISEFETNINKGLSLSNQKGTFIPLCHKCQTEMKFKKGNIGESGFYYCTKHRKKISITVKELNDCITDAVQNLIVPTISPKTSKSIKTISVKVINNIAKELRTAASNMKTELEELCIQVSKKFKPNDLSSIVDKSFKRIDFLRDQITSTEEQLDSLYSLTQEVHLLEELMQIRMNKLEFNEVSLLAELLISSIVIYEDYVFINVYFGEYFNLEEAKSGTT